MSIWPAVFLLMIERRNKQTMGPDRTGPLKWIDGNLTQLFASAILFTVDRITICLFNSATRSSDSLQQTTNSIFKHYPQNISVFNSKFGSSDYVKDCFRMWFSEHFWFDCNCALLMQLLLLANVCLKPGAPFQTLCWEYLAVDNGHEIIIAYLLSLQYSVTSLTVEVGTGWFFEFQYFPSFFSNMETGEKDIINKWDRWNG